MADDPLRDLRELITETRADIRDDLAGLRGELGKLVPRESWELRNQALEHANATLAAEIATLKQARIDDQKKADAEREQARSERKALRKWVISGLIVPIVAVVLAYVLTLRGGG